MEITATSVGIILALIALLQTAIEVIKHTLKKNNDKAEKTEITVDNRASIDAERWSNLRVDIKDLEKRLEMVTLVLSKLENSLENVSKLEDQVDLIQIKMRNIKWYCPFGKYNLKEEKKEETEE